MSCETGPWSFTLPGIQAVSSSTAEIQPYTLNYKKSLDKLSFARTKFPTEVGEMLRPETHQAGGRLRSVTPANLYYGGEFVAKLLFNPDDVQYSDDATHVEFKDPQWVLDSGVVDRDWSGDAISLQYVYKTVFEQREDRGVIEGIKFQTGGEDIAIVSTIEEEETNAPGITEVHESDLNNYDQYYQTDAIYTSKASMNFNKVSPLEAIWRLNRVTGFRAWLDEDRYLTVGNPHDDTQYHIAAPDDSRVWRFRPNEVQIRHPREPIKRVAVEGEMIDGEGIDIGDTASYFNPTSKDGIFNAGDYYILGVVERTDIDFGQTVHIKNHSIPKDLVRPTAYNQMRHRMMDANSGTIEIVPELSGDYTKPHLAEPGDLIQVVPEDRYFDGVSATSGEIGDSPSEVPECYRPVNNELYVINEVQHDVDGSGFWSVTLDLTMYPDEVMNPEENLNSHFRYINHRTGEYAREHETYQYDPPGDFD